MVQLSNHSPPPRSLRARFSLNALSFGYVQVVTVVIQLFLVPFFLHYWGVTRYAEWLVITGIPQMLVLLDLGVTQASANRATMLMGAGDVGNARAALHSSLVFTLFICVAVMFATSLVCASTDLSNFLDLSTLSSSDANAVLLLMTGYLCTNFLAGYVGAWFRAIDRTALGTFLLANRRVAEVGIVATVLVLGGDAREVAFSMLAGQVFITTILFIVAVRLSPLPMFGISSGSIDEIKKIWKPAIGSLSVPLAQVITLQGGIQLLNLVASPAVIVVYTMARTLMRLVIQVGLTANNALVPELSRMIGRGEGESVKKFTFVVSCGVFSICLVMYFFLAYWGPTLVQWWGMGRVEIDSDVLILVGLHTIINVGWFVPSALKISTNKHATIGITYATSSLITILVWWLYMDQIDPFIGACLLLTVPEIIVFASLLLPIGFTALMKSNNS